MKVSAVTLRRDDIPACQLCYRSLAKSEHVYDSPVSGGPWAYLCKSCFVRYGSRSLGTKHILVDHPQTQAPKPMTVGAVVAHKRKAR